MGWKGGLDLEEWVRFIEEKCEILPDSIVKQISAARSSLG